MVSTCTLGLGSYTNGNLTSQPPVGTDTPLLSARGKVPGPPAFPWWGPKPLLWPTSNLGLTLGAHCSKEHCAISVIFTEYLPENVPCPDMEGQVVPAESKGVEGCKH